MKERVRDILKLQETGLNTREIADELSLPICIVDSILYNYSFSLFRSCFNYTETLLECTLLYRGILRAYDSQFCIVKNDLSEDEILSINSECMNEYWYPGSKVIDAWLKIREDVLKRRGNTIS